MSQTKHRPVLLAEVLAYLKPQLGASYLDLTAGYGGHAEAIAKKIGSQGSITLVDRDAQASEYLKNKFKNNPNVRVIHSDFLSASRQLQTEDNKFDVILADLGVSSVHFDDAKRGFSLSSSGPLDMRMDQSQELSASSIVNGWNEGELSKILHHYGEVKNARKLAKKIVQSRPITDTRQLAELVASQSRRRRRSRIHPATTAFQAIRIAVNDELIQLEKSLPIWVELLNTGGRLGVISFHSLEDRCTKQSFQHYGGNRYDAKLQTVTKKPVTASTNEVVFNPRARSALFRVTQRK